MWSNYPEIYNELEQVENFIVKNIKSKNNLLDEAVNSVVSSGGKRLRPAFVIIASKFGRYKKGVIPVAAAIEILHTATLIHDDVIDKAKLRRGNKTISEELGVEMAVYTGDFLFTKAVLMLSSHVSVEKLSIVAKTIKSICEGEVDQFQDKYNIDTSVFRYLKRVSRKTAALFSSSLVLGGYISKCPNNILKVLARFGFYYGVAFQIRDDIDNFKLTKGTKEKPAGNDILEGVVTLPFILALKNNPDIRKDMSSFMEKKGEVSSEELIRIVQMIKDSNGINLSWNLLNKYVERAMNALEYLPENKYRETLKDIIKSTLL